MLEAQGLRMHTSDRPQVLAVLLLISNCYVTLCLVKDVAFKTVGCEITNLKMSNFRAKTSSKSPMVVSIYQLVYSV